MNTVFDILLFILNLMWFIVIANIIMSWLVSFQVLNIRQPLVAQIYYGMERIMEPVYKPIRRLIPPMGGLDFAPVIVILGIFALQRLLINNYGAFG